MQLDPQRIRSEREQRAWTQSHLAMVSGLGLRTIQRIEAASRASFESASAVAAAFGVPVAALRAVDDGEADQHPPMNVTKRMAGKNVLVRSAVAGLAVAMLIAANPFGAISPEAGYLVDRLKQQLCVYDENIYSVGSTIRAVRGVDGMGNRIAEEPDVPILSCERRGLFARWEVIGPSV